ncbi:hypothetical protein GUITHDRAFT_156384 [Guillardia theta CCMP2712]|uniref:Uncharacterized protein n=1 Tax=Guillardia theta (strain CCMP2712) TaxID=905079 RepID=L1I7U0_GUITC|nr:hypothetical protein GUITHDRAFT_156384 [Guillardia theta CCMP2712]EKX32273.1 hypothetical protein GUITHDRAFT_156384 [Guillardia theta CCMP2712]|eukprot:XP_005819253.1 hypothetical protein GUITHDRAFT_156384 [Guillardia theta CCMP2712]
MPGSDKVERSIQHRAYNLLEAGHSASKPLQPTNFTDTAAFVSPRVSKHDNQVATSSQERKWRVLPQMSQEQTPSINSDSSFVNEGIIAVGTDRIDLEDVSWQMVERQHAGPSHRPHPPPRQQEKPRAKSSWSSDSDDSDDFYGQPTSLSLLGDKHRNISARKSAGGYRSFQQDNAARMLDSETSDSDKN